MSARIQVHDEDAHALDVRVYQERTASVDTKHVRDALRVVHTAVLAHMSTATYVDVYRKSLRDLDDALRQLLPEPSADTDTNMRQLESALHAAQTLTKKIPCDEDGVRMTSSQRAFMQAFYTFQLRALDAAWKCLVWLSKELVKLIADCRADMRRIQAQCKQWRMAWNGVMQPAKLVTSEPPVEVVAAWRASRPLREQCPAECQRLVERADQLEHEMLSCVATLRNAREQFEASALVHLQDIERLKNSEIGKMRAHVVPVELEVVWLKTYMAHVRDLLSSSPVLNLFL